MGSILDSSIYHIFMMHFVRITPPPPRLHTLVLGQTCILLVLVYLILWVYKSVPTSIIKMTHTPHRSFVQLVLMLPGKNRHTENIILPSSIKQNLIHPMNAKTCFYIKYFELSSSINVVIALSSNQPKSVEHLANYITPCNIWGIPAWVNMMNDT